MTSWFSQSTDIFPCAPPLKTPIAPLTEPTLTMQSSPQEAETYLHDNELTVIGLWPDGRSRRSLAGGSEPGVLLLGPKLPEVGIIHVP